MMAAEELAQQSLPECSIYLGRSCTEGVCPGLQRDEGYTSDVVDFGGYVSGSTGTIEWCGQDEVPPMVDLRRYHKEKYQA